MKVIKGKIAIPSPPPAGDNGPRGNSRGLTWEPVMSTRMWVRMATMRTRMGIVTVQAGTEIVGNKDGRFWWCRRNCVTERRRR